MLWHLSNDSRLSQPAIEIINAVSDCDSTSSRPFATPKSTYNDSRKKSNIGKWSENATDYSFGNKYGNNLFLTAAGASDYYNGILFYRGIVGFYQSSILYGADDAWHMGFDNWSASTGYYTYPWLLCPLYRKIMGNVSPFKIMFI